MSKRVVVFAALCAALNLALGTIVYLVKLPLYLDMVGTILCALALRRDRRVAFAASAIAGPIARVSFWARLIPLGVATGLVAAIVSAPVVAYLFGGVTGSGSAALVAFFLKTGDQLMKAALMSGLTAEPVDKTIQLLLSVLLLRATPESFLSRLLPAAGADSGS
jgi:energy-coupling factor transport system substrate-specific component